MDRAAQCGTNQTGTNEMAKKHEQQNQSITAQVQQNSTAVQVYDYGDD